jgi:FAD/FMN-containing dehydrogenase
MALTAWGQLPARPAEEDLGWSDRSSPLPECANSLLVQGNGRSYGDVCLNSGGTLLRGRDLARFIAFDAQSGRLTCEAGVLLAEILEVFVPRGWFLPVTPGTRFVTVAGAIANDVHGKNHHGSGTFGRFVRRFELLRSDGTRRVCSLDENAAWFAATIGGLGLTGLINWVEIELRRISSPNVAVQNKRFNGLDEFFALNSEAEAQHEYTVAWIDCLAETPRGILMAGDHVSAADSAGLVAPLAKPLSFPLTPPISLINGLSLRAFNFAYFHRPLPASAVVHFAPYFYPLDGILHWNRLYGRRGFFQYQCVLPLASRAALADILRSIAASGLGSFLAVLKTFGALPSPGLLSFPMPGMTLALDFPNSGAATLALFERLDAIVEAAGGRIYAAKDARASGAFFRRSYPRFSEFLSFVDPKFSSDFWRRIVE